MHASLCVCALIPRPPIETRTKLVLFIHRAEDRKSSNTGRLAAECLANREIIVRGREDAPTPPFTWDRAGPQPVLLFPHEDAAPLTSFTGPLTLVVPDGTWRQASKVRNRVPNVRDLPCVRLPDEAPSSYRLRAEAHEGRLSTIEAVARAMGILEGPHVRDAMERVFRAMVERTLWANGELDAAEVTSGIPDGVMRHDPTSGLGVVD